MPTYTTTDAYTPYHEFGIALSPGATITTENILTEVKAPVATPEDYTIGETVEIGSAACTGVVWGNGSDGLRLIQITGTVPTDSATITGAVSSEAQDAICQILCVRSSDDPLPTALLSSTAVTSTGTGDEQTVAIGRDTSFIVIHNVTGTPITVRNGTTLAIATLYNSFGFDPLHQISLLTLDFAAAGGCTVDQYTESAWTGWVRQMLLSGAYAGA